MPRKKRQEEPDDHNRWIVSYADFITLLFALFAVMYAMSSLNLEKYAAMSASMTTAFSKFPQPLKAASSSINTDASEFKIFPNPNSLALWDWGLYNSSDLWWADALSSQPAKPPAELIGDTVQNADQPESAASDQTSATMPPPETIALIEENQKKAMENQEIQRITEEMTKIANDIKMVLGPMIRLGNVTVTQSGQSVSIEINASILFDPGKAKLNADSTHTLGAIAHVLSGGNNKIRVEGYTDNMSVNNGLFPSNWELSAHRAATVAHLFTENGIVDERITAIGHGKNNPAESNDTPEGRAHNRRVIVSILASKGSND